MRVQGGLIQLELDLSPHDFDFPPKYKNVTRPELTER